MVEPGLSPELAQGLFAASGRYRVVMRLSTQPGDILDDAVSAARGMAIKVLDVDGQQLRDAEAGTTHNFVFASDPAFAAPNAEKFLGSLKQLAGTTDKAEWEKSCCPPRCGGWRICWRPSAVRARC